MYITTDDLCLSNLKAFEYWDKVKIRYPRLHLLVFAIANYKGVEDIGKSAKFVDWFEAHKDWVTVGLHGYDHMHPPEQERDDAQNLGEKSIEILSPFLPERFLYRPPGFQRSVKTEPMLRRLGVTGIAYQTWVKWFDTESLQRIEFNSHCTENKYDNSIGRIWQKLILKT